MGRRPTGPWPGSVVDRLRFERGARRAYPTLRGGPNRRTASRGFTYTATVNVPWHEPRNVTVVFRAGGRTPMVFADGPTESPHRYGDGGLCMWLPADQASQQWRFDHGLLDLLDAVVAHLFREGWWREHDEWLGPEVGHTRPATNRPEEAA